MLSTCVRPPHQYSERGTLIAWGVSRGGRLPFVVGVSPLEPVRMLSSQRCRPTSVGAAPLDRAQTSNSRASSARAEGDFEFLTEAEALAALTFAGPDSCVFRSHMGQLS